MTGAAPTQGWDLVYAVRLPQVNAQIAAQNLSPRAFSGTTDGAAISGTFGTWQIVPGGAEYLVNLAIPISGTIGAPNGTLYPFSGTGKVQVQLTYLAAEMTAATTSSLQIAQPGGSSSLSEQLFSVHKVELGPDAPLGETIMVETVIGQWLQANPGAFNHVFAVVDLTAVAAEAPYAWLKPTSLSYAYVDGATESDCLLAILAMTQSDSDTLLAQQVAATVVPEGQDAALLISPSLLLGRIIRDALPTTFPGTTIADYALASDTPTLSLTTPCQLSSIDYQGQTYQPLLETFSVEFNGDQITCTSRSSIPVGDGVTAHTSVIATQALTLVANAQGQQTLSFTEVAPPQVTHWTTTDPTTDQTDQDIGIGIIVASVVASVFTGGIAGIFVILGGVLVGGVVADLPQLIAAWTPDTAPSLDLVAINMTAPFTWAGGAAFSVATADLSESLRLSGTPWPQIGKQLPA